MTLAFDFFSGAPFNVLTVAVALFGVSVAIVAAIYARQAVFPGKRILRIRHSEGVPLVPQTGDVRLSILVEVENNVVDDPFITTIEVSSSGRYDIRSDDFDQKNPVAVDFGRIVTLAGLGSSAASRISTKGTTVRIAPSLLKRSDVLAFSVITEGAPEKFAVSSSLIDTKVVVSAVENPIMVWRRTARVTMSLGLMQTAALLFVTYLFYSSSNQLLSTLDSSAALIDEVLKSCGIR